MSLLREIQDAAISTDTPLPDVLRKCLVLAARIENDTLRDWARAELDGYASHEQVPDYRDTGTLEAVGTFMRGPQFWPRLPIAPACIPEEHHRRLFSHQFIVGVAALGPLAAAEDNLRVPWPANALALHGDKIWHGMACIEAHIEMPPALIAGVLDTIRNRILTFTLEISKEAPEAGEVPASEIGVSGQRIDQLFQTFVTAPVGALAIGGGHVTQNLEFEITPGDFESLRAALVRLGLGQQDIDELEHALAADGAAQGDGGLGPATASWLERIRAEADDRAIDVGTGVTAGVITELLMRFVG